MPHNQQGSPEWHALRKNKIGASDSSIILGINPWKTARQLWEEKLDITPQPPMNQAMLRGHELEPIAREFFITTTGKEALPAVLCHPELNWMMASLDGINHEEEFVLEIKCGGQKLHDQAKIGVIPDYYMCQIQHQLCVTGFSKAMYLSYFEGEGIIIPVDRNDQFIEDTLVPSLKEFWDCLSNLVEPALQDGDYVKMDSYAWNVAANNYKDISAQIKQLTEYQETLKNDIINLSYDRNCLGSGIRITKTKRKGVVDYGSIPELKDVNLENYRKKGSEYWTIREV